MSSSISPLAPKSYADMPAIRGVRMATAAAGIKYKNRTDVLLMAFDKPASVAGVFTRSKCPSAPVDFCRKNLAAGVARGVVVNSGNANAFTGIKGRAATELTAKSAAAALGCDESEIFLASTGVIGEPLDATKFSGVLGQMAKDGTGDFWLEAAKAIMTTDTYPKVATRTAEIGGVTVTINGIAKGAGMIAPDMATMLSFIFTDAPIAPAALQALLKAGVEDTFNAVTIDGDTSTSDTLLAFATGAAAAQGAPKISRASDPRLKALMRGFVRLVRLEPGRLEINLPPDAPKTLVGDLQKRLEEWTEIRWMVILSREEGAPTLVEVENTTRETRLRDARQDPDVAAILARFPGAKITDVRIKAGTMEEDEDTRPPPAIVENDEGDILPGDDIEF